MVVYPLDGWNTFIDVADATTRLTELGSGSKWDPLTTAEKEAMLHKSAAIINATCNLNTTCQFDVAQVLLIQGDLENNGKYLSMTDTSVKYKSAKVGSLDVEYNLTESGEVLLPPVVKSLLSSCLKNSSVPMAKGFTLA
ncbi:hypothetical protein PF327_10805 [Sulfurovum sp. XTW-4]|uniref:Uncharacterized protein n=1 Tax=Sulfurovum xiamenensis TaxID=3019066 RepID=A0ABT7QUD8_9BACT|nr:hypothetical protein [Sulfurovum xiamenensis]MDM5264684.1 hypothetical protein [Sulfurovum xiamenensis]